MTDLAILHLGSPLSYLLAFALPALDAILPAIPSEAALVALGVATAGHRRPHRALVGLGALGVFLGDNLSYLLGRRFAPAVENSAVLQPQRRPTPSLGPKCPRALRGAPDPGLPVHPRWPHRRHSHLRHRLLPPSQFLAATAMAATIWACYAFFIGRLGGKAFDGRPWASFLVAAAAAVALSALVEIGRRAPRWLRSIHPQRTQ